ncbi:uncharacterized protein LOC100890518 [Strongylocentrotus purpuratus]|uniref:CARD domain-containing protein n=1 Tax=Strongylocentrotus purpuratus TaxID=7668 RepID=A0A7M7SZ35_STRPU|nr:uncharacterized protein LOC100890518 [Strongylocentrotus purpuratus]
MDVMDRMVLQKNWTYLLDSLNSEDVIPYLIQDLILDFEMVEEIEAAETKKKRTRRLMTKLMQRGPTAYQAFRKSLLEKEVYEHLVQRLDSTEIDPATLPVPAPNSPQSGNIQIKQPDLGITQMDEDTPSQPSTLSSQTFQPKSQSVQQTPPQLPQPSPSSLPPATGSNNFRISGNNNFVIMGSNNTQVYYH